MGRSLGLRAALALHSHWKVGARSKAAEEPRVGALPFSCLILYKGILMCFTEAKFPLLTTRPENSEHAHTFNTFTFRSTFMHPKPPLTCGGCHLPEETTPCPHFQTACRNNILRQQSGSPENSSGLTHRQACMSRSCGTSTGTGRSPEQAGEMLA